MDGSNTLIGYAGKMGSLPKKIEDVTTNISKGADTLNDMVDKMGNALGKAQARNPVSGAVISGMTKVAGAMDKVTDKIADAADALDKAGGRLAQATGPVSAVAQRVDKAAKDLENCYKLMPTFAHVVDAVIDSCSGHFHPRTNEQLMAAFDSQWDSWARLVNDTYSRLYPVQQGKILEELAQGCFGDEVYFLGSAIKNEAPNIFGGIADFGDALDVFSGSYRDPIAAAKKIEAGVKGIVNATERVANAINRMIVTGQTRIPPVPVEANPILTYIGNLHDTQAVAAINKILTAGGGAATLATDVTAFGQAWQSKDIGAMYSAGKKAYDDARDIIDGLRDNDAATKVTQLAPTGGRPGIAFPKGGAWQQAAAGGDEPDSDSANGDSYVCSGATMKCSFGDKSARLTVYPDRTVFLTGQPMANITDHISLYNIAPFGKCRTTNYPATGAATAAAHGKLTPMPCVPGTVSDWINGKDDYLIKGSPALLKSSYCKCQWGGIIRITDDGQQ